MSDIKWRSALIRSASASALPAILFTILILAGSVAYGGEPINNGPLRVHRENPRYFADGTGKAVYLTGAHTWNLLPDMRGGADSTDR